MTQILRLHKRWLKNPKYRKADDAPQDEFALAAAVIAARKRAGLTQEQLARKMGTTQPVIARLEAGNNRPSLRTLERLAHATGSRLVIAFQARKKPAKKQAIGSTALNGAVNPAQAARKTA
jgi:transcriptional regulator with XRE-family HTH domain